MKNPKMFLVMFLISCILFESSLNAQALPNYCPNTVTTDTTAYGGCILFRAITAPTNQKDIDQNPVTVSGGTCIDASLKYIYGYGLMFAGSLSGVTTSDEAICWVAKAHQEMFASASSDSNCDQYNQFVILQKAWEYLAAIPLAQATISPTTGTTLPTNWSQCDIISIADPSSTTASGQIKEIIEHLLIAISNTGFNQAMPAYFGINSITSKQYCAMKEAIGNNVFITTAYSNLTGTEQNRVLMQKYFYWLVTTAWGFQATYGASSTEWPYTSFINLQACDKNPRGVDLYNNVISKIIKMPSTTTLTSLGNLMSGGTPDTSPCSQTVGSTPTGCCCTCSGGCVEYDTPDGSQAACTKNTCTNSETNFTWSKTCSKITDQCYKGNILISGVFMILTLISIF